MRHQLIADRTGKPHLHRYMGSWCFTLPSVTEHLPPTYRREAAAAPYRWALERAGLGQPSKRPA